MWWTSGFPEIMKTWSADCMKNVSPTFGSFQLLTLFLYHPELLYHYIPLHLGTKLKEKKFWTCVLSPFSIHQHFPSRYGVSLLKGNFQWQYFGQKRPPTMTLTSIDVIINKCGFWRYLLCWELIKVLLKNLMFSNNKPTEQLKWRVILEFFSFTSFGYHIKSEHDVFFDGAFLWWYN